MNMGDTWKSHDMTRLARAWLDEIRSNKPSTDGDVGETVVLMNFTAPPDVQWSFLKAAVTAAETDDELGAIAAGPFERLLGSHGEEYITLVESLARDQPAFARMTTGAWQHLMSEEVWSRVQAIQAAVQDPI